LSSRSAAKYAAAGFRCCSGMACSIRSSSSASLRMPSERMSISQSASSTWCRAQRKPCTRWSSRLAASNQTLCAPQASGACAISCVVHGVAFSRPSVNGTGRLARWRRTHPGSSTPSRSHRPCTTAQILAMSKRRGPTRCHHRHRRGASAIIRSRRSASEAAQSLTNWRTATTLPRPSSRAIPSGRPQARNSRVAGSITDATPSHCAGAPESLRSESGTEDRGLSLMHRLYCCQWCGREGEPGPGTTGSCPAAGARSGMAGAPYWVLTVIGNAIAGMLLLQDRLGPVRERVDHGHGVESLTVLEVFGQQMVAARGLRGGHDQTVPVRQAESVLGRERRVQQAGANRHRHPRTQVVHIGAGVARREARSELAGDGDVVLVEDLHTGTAQPRRPQRRHPLMGAFLFGGHREVPRVHEHIRVDEDAHRASASVDLVAPGQGTVLCAQRCGPAAQIGLTSPLEALRGRHPLSKNPPDKARHAHVMARRLDPSPACSLLVQADGNIPHRITISVIS